MRHTAPPSVTPPPCAACRWLRRAAAAALGLGVVAWLLAGPPSGIGPQAAQAAQAAPAAVAAPTTPAPSAAAPASPPHTPPGSPPASPPASPPVAPAPTAPVAPADPGPELVYDRLVLVRLPVGLAWRGLRLVRKGQPPYALVFDADRLPPGLHLGADGWLRGTPTATGRYDFLLRLDGPPGSPPRAQQRYRIDVTAPARPPEPPPPPVLSPDSATRTIDTTPHLPRTWRLSAQAVDRLSQPDPPTDAELEDPAAAAEAPPAVPTAQQLLAILGPLQDLEFATEQQLRDALQASVCRYYVQHLMGEAATSAAPATASAGPAPPPAGPAIDLRCPPTPLSERAQAQATAREAGGLSHPQFHAALMSPERADAVVAEALDRHELSALKPLDLTGTPGCGCNLSEPDGEVYGFLGYWHGSLQPQPVNYGLYTRLGYLGALLKDDGSTTASFADGSGQDLRFVRRSQRHASRVDLVLHKRDWAAVAAHSERARASFIANAVSEAVRLAHTPLHDAYTGLHRLLIPPWRESDHAFDGLTLWFDEPLADAREAAAFKSFVHAFVPALMQEMRRQQRGLRLNLVIPEQRLGAAGGPWEIDWLWKTWHATEDGMSDEQIADRRRALFLGKTERSEHRTDITVRFLVLLSEPTTDSKKRLRARLDASSDATGPRRVALLRDMVPVLMHQREGPVQDVPRARADQLVDDFAYMGWNFGGVGLWPLPVADRGRGEGVTRLLQGTYGQPAHWGDGLCALICPNRVPLRLALQVLVLIGVVSIGLYLWNCDVRRLGRPYEAGLLLGGLLTAGVALALLSCDPDLEDWRRANAILYIVTGALFAWLAWRRLRPLPPMR